MNWIIWDEIEATLDRFDVKPIIAVVPDCKDEKLHVGQHSDEFWDRVLSWQSKGWTIAMHGYNHLLFKSPSKSLINISHLTEFTSLSYADQRAKIKAGLSIFNAHGIKTHTWVAPAHTFDKVTLQVLRECGFSHVSDGLFFWPILDSFGLKWIPQQIWRFRKMPLGTWTICLHHNSWDENTLEKFKKDLAAFKWNLIGIQQLDEDVSVVKNKFFILIQKFCFTGLFLIKRTIKKYSL